MSFFQRLKMSLARFRILIREGEVRAGGRIPVHRLDDMLESVGIDQCKLCTYCWNGKED